MSRKVIFDRWNDFTLFFRMAYGILPPYHVLM